MYANPHGTFSRSLNSLFTQTRRVLLTRASTATQTEFQGRMSEIMQSRLALLESRNLIIQHYQNEILGKIELTLQAREIIEKGLSSSDIASLRKLGETH